jgi:GNAT superfamily N-acetyltransferase
VRPIAKAITIYRTDGLAYTAGCLCRLVTTCCALRRSETLFLRRGAATALADVGRAAGPEFVLAKDAFSLEEHVYAKLAYLPYRRWFDAGSVCFLGLVQGKVVSYCWAHRRSYSLGRIGSFRLRDNEWWIGPVFVDKRCRRQGINTAQIHHAIRELSGRRGKVFYTATNASNHASMKSFVRCGFVVIGRCRLRMLWRWPVCRTIWELNDQGLMAKCLQ